MFVTFFSRSMFPKSTHETFAQKLYQTFKNNKRFIKPKLSRTSFTISHYAGEVNMSGMYSFQCQHKNTGSFAENVTFSR